MWNARCSLSFVFIVFGLCYSQDNIHEISSTLIDHIEETSSNINDEDGISTTEKLENWDDLDKTILIFDNIFDQHNETINEWKTDNLSIFGKSDTETDNWNIFEVPNAVTTESIKISSTIDNSITTTNKQETELNIYKNGDSENIETTAFLTDSSSTTEFTYFNEFDESTTHSGNLDTEIARNERNMTKLILNMIEELKSPNPVGIPGVDIPDPNPIPDMSQSITMFDKLYFTDSVVRGMSKLKILYINVDVERLQIQAAMYIERLQTSGRYLYSAFMLSRGGPYSVDIHGLLVTARANLGVKTDGTLRAEDINMDLTHESIKVNFENLDPIIGGVINGAGNFIFETAKPYMLEDAYTKIRTAIDTELERTAEDMQFSNSLPPLDMIILDIGKNIKELGLDPYRIEDYVNNNTVAFMSVVLSNTWLTGISTCHRVGDITIKIANGTSVLDFEVGTKTLEGKTGWNIRIGDLISNAGKVSFSIEHITIKVVIAQPLDTRKRPKLNDLQIEVGNFQIRSDGAGSVDYILELAVNILPNLLRYQLVDALEWPLKSKIQEELGKINVEKTLKQVLLPKLEEMQETGFKLSSLRIKETEAYSDDEFFNF